VARISAKIFIESDSQSLEEMELSIGVASQGGWRKGDARGATGKVYATSSWQVESTSYADDENGDHQSEVLSRVTAEVLGWVAGHEASFRQCVDGATAGILFSVSAEMIPPLIFSPEHVAAIAHLRISLEVDIVLTAS
jgi:hypothetical protein